MYELKYCERCAFSFS